MTRHKKTWDLIYAARDILEEQHPMTVRQVYYQLVSRQVVKNNKSRYQAVCDALRDARIEGIIPWEWIEDRLRRARPVPMYADLSDFLNSVRHAYRRDVWADQPRKLEVWLEKDALSGIFEDALLPYGVTLNVGRGYDGWSSIKRAADRWGDGDGVTVLYFGDFDPSGEDMARSLRDRFAALGSEPDMPKCAIAYEDIQRYKLPPDGTKATDSRREAFVERWGDVSVELDALPTRVLRDRLVGEVESRMDLDALAATREQQRLERDRLTALLEDV